LPVNRVIHNLERSAWDHVARQEKDRPVSKWLPPAWFDGFANLFHNSKRYSTPTNHFSLPKLLFDRWLETGYSLIIPPGLVFKACHPVSGCIDFLSSQNIERVRFLTRIGQVFGKPDQHPLHKKRRLSVLEGRRMQYTAD
jgi:hypothetical protein